jgi:peptidoglycan/LPS O-acetylase OafA/YrhL
MTSSKQGKRWDEFDAVRALAMVYIVGIWHQLDYFEALKVHDLPVLKALTIAALGIFFFISSFLLTARQGDAELSWASVKQFYTKRILRLYPLYCIAVILFFVLDIGRDWDLGRLFSALFLVAAILDNAPATLWFINVIFLYYLILPIFWLLSRSLTKSLLVGGFIFAVLVILDSTTSLIDEQLPQYFPSFLFGALLGRQAVAARRWMTSKSIAFGAVIVCGLLFSVRWLTPLGLNIWFQYLTFALLPLASLPPALWVGNGLMKNPVLANLMRTLSYASFSCYLFHRVIYGVFYKFAPIPDNVVIFSIVALFIAFPLAFVLSLLFQMAWDRLWKVQWQALLQPSK